LKSCAYAGRKAIARNTVAKAARHPRIESICISGVKRLTGKYKTMARL
jgi:hypothetical protein